MKREIPFIRSIEWERQVGFDPTVDYISILNEYNRFVEAKDKESISRLLTEQGGLIQLCGKASYQKGLQTGIVYIKTINDSN